MQEIRRDYIADLKGIKTRSSAESEDINLALEWLSGERPVNKPLNMDRHLGVLVLVFSNEASDVFLLFHRKAGIWLPPGGHVDVGQNFQSTAELEMEEELGMKFDFSKRHPFYFVNTLTQGSNAGHIDATAYFLVQADKESKFSIQEKEALEGRWFLVDEVITNPAFKHLHVPILKAIEDLRHE